MKLGYEMKIEQTQKLTMTHELIQAIKLLTLNTQEINEYVQEELLINPVLETVSTDSQGEFQEGSHGAGESNAGTINRREKESVDRQNAETDWTEQIERLRECGKDDISYRQWESRSDSTEYNMENFTVYTATLNDHLTSQLQLIKLLPAERKIAVYLIESIDDNGYITAKMEDTCRIFNVDTETVEKVVKQLQTFDPAGIAARDLQECLRIQLKEKLVYDDNYEKLITEYMDAIAGNKMAWVAKQLNLSLAEIQSMSDVIRGLEPKPGRQFASSGGARYIIPDLLLEKNREGYVVTLNDASIPKLRLSSYYTELLDKSSNDEELAEYLKKKVNAATWIIKSIEQRNQTIISVASAIVNHQKDFFDDGERHLKPLTLRQIADEVGVHESTVSRSISGKYLQAISGVYELKFFFSRGLSDNSGGEVASYNIKKRIKEIILEEDAKSPLSDEHISKLLQNGGVEISRRTVAKYRDEMNIAASSKRRRF